MKNLILLFFFCYQWNLSFAQTGDSLKWWNPADNNYPVIEGQAWPDKVANPYDRLPASAEKTIPSKVWELSHNSAGMLIRFKSNAENIVVRYLPKERLAMPHMPATGVSGLDLYARDKSGRWLWCRGHYQFGDTVIYQFSGIDPSADYQQKGLEYFLYLPLYNTIKWMEVGVPKESGFTPQAVRKEKPIVIYGTSITQGACASRPGMAWTSLLGRELNKPVVNLGFSGNGQLDSGIIDLMTKVNASIYILDCLPNMTLRPGFPAEEVYRRILAAVNKLKKLRPETPIILAEHDGYSDGLTNPARSKQYEAVNKVLQNAYHELLANHIKGLYILRKDSIHQDINSMVDGTHPSDRGMVNYAEAYKKCIMKIWAER